MQLLLRFLNTIPICTVDYKDETLRTGVVMPPERPNLVLTADILKRTQVGQSKDGSYITRLI